MLSNEPSHLAALAVCGMLATYTTTHSHSLVLVSDHRQPNMEAERGG
jgi:hypothetical protein